MRASDVTELIARKRDGLTLAPAAIESFVRAMVAGDVPDHQTAALLMAIRLRGLDVDETVALTRAITASGEVLDFGDLGPVVDKHSTGGVGDSVSLIAAPLAAACGAVVPMISGRALGHTGGTLDKLESIPGLRTTLDAREFRGAVERAGLAIVEASPELAPGDAILYRLRDATATVGEPGLITSSILGKKCCVRPHGLVMDLKVGDGGFAGNEAAARQLVAHIGAVAQQLGLNVRFLLTSMQEPLSTAIGNAVEVRRCLRILRGEVRSDSGMHGGALQSLSMLTAAHMLVAAGIESEVPAASARVEAALAAGDGLARLRRCIEAQGGDARTCDDPSRLPQAAATHTIGAPRAGTVLGIDALAAGIAAAHLGVGSSVDDSADPGAGIELHVEPGDTVHAGEALATLYAHDADRLTRGAAQLAAGIRIGDGAATRRSLVIDAIV